MVVTKINQVVDMYLNMFRTTEYKQLKDEDTGKKVTNIQEYYRLDLYNSRGKIETHKV